MAVQFIFVDAGQGDCTLIQLPDNRCILVDAGCMKNTKVVDTQILAVLKRVVEQSPTKSLKALILTHPDKDHYNRVMPLIVGNNIPIDALYVGEKIKSYDIAG